MTIMARENKKQYDPAPEGLHHAVCVDVVDLGMQPSPWGEKPKVRLVWEIDLVNEKIGKRFIASRQFGLSLSEKSHLRPFLEAWRSRKFTAEELTGFDLEVLVGVNCQLQIIHNIKDNSTYANVQAIVPPPKGVPAIRPSEGYVRVKDRPAQGHSDQPEGGDDDSIPF